MPGKKDLISIVGVEGKRVHQQKRLLLTLGMLIKNLKTATET